MEQTINRRNVREDTVSTYLGRFTQLPVGGGGGGGNHTNSTAKDTIQAFDKIIVEYFCGIVLL